MNRLDDTLTEVQAAFEKEYEKRFGHSKLGASFRAEVAHFFIAGRDSLREERASVKPKRTITNLFEFDGDIYAVSSDGKLYSTPCWVYGDKMTRPKQWHKWPDLPQED